MLSGSNQTVAICMATYNPPLELFRRQIESIRQQSYSNWRCYLSDDDSRPEVLTQMREVIAGDDRFMLLAAPERLGYYRNFERSLRMIQPEERYFALADQDDFWYPEKLQTLLEQFGKNTLLAYSNARIVDASGKVIRTSGLSKESSNSSDLVSLVFSNSITGAAAMFSASLLRYALPFPEQVETLAHDHWLACVAMSLGKVKYVDRCLYDYVQHSGNAIGFHQPADLSPGRHFYYSLRDVVTRRDWLPAQEIFRRDVRKIVLLAEEILQRGGDSLTKSNKAGLRRLAKLTQSPAALPWLLWRGLKTTKVTAGAEYHLALGLWWKLLSKFKS